MIDASLLPHTTPKQREYLEAVEQYGTQTAAAAALGINKSVIGRAIQAVKKKLADSTAAPVVNRKLTTGSKKIFVLPDVQAKPGNDFSYLRRLGAYVLAKRPDILVCIGDFADMESLSSYDKGKKSFEGRRYKRDIEAAKEAMRAFLGPIAEYNATAKTPYEPVMHMFLGNHEDRITRCINEDPKLDGVLSIDDLEYKDFGWYVHPFLEVGLIEGVAFSHYFTSGVMGRAVSTAQACLTKKHMSCVQGHQQGLQIATGYRGDGQLLWSIIAGSCYEHDEAYLGAQGNKHWRGFLVLHSVHDGTFDPMPVSLAYINRKYAHIRIEPEHVTNEADMAA